MRTRQMTHLVIIFAVCTGVGASYDISFAQEIPQTGYPQGYFRDPLDLPIHLAGNYGELRPDHFHMGLDMKTNGRENYPVYAAADGYISHIKIEPSGFGNAIYINHPNGYTTVYVHLNSFFPALQQYVKEQQYRLEQWEVFLDIPEGLFPVKKGQFIASSGNTGGSMAPHLHFEIRDTKTDENRNPLLFGLPITDRTPPSLLRLGVYDGDESTYLQTPRLYPLVRPSEEYTVLGGLVTTFSDKVRLAIQTVDHQTGSANALGIYSASVSMDGHQVSGFVLDRIGYDMTRYVNAHVDYSLKTGGGPYLEYLSPLPGNLLPIYQTQGQDGFLHLDDNDPHIVGIEVRDGLGNTSKAKFTIRKAGLPPVYDGGSLFLPNQVNVFDNDEFLVYLPEHCLYDGVRPVFEQKGAAGGAALSPGYSVISALVPAQDSFTVSIKPSVFPAGEDSGRCVIQQKGAGQAHVAKVQWDKGWATVRMRNFGTFQLIRDDVPPVISPLGWKDGGLLAGRPAIAVSVTDNLGATHDFRGELDGKWLMFSQRGNDFTYRFDEHFPPGQHTLVLSVADEAGNVTTKTYQVNR